MEHEVGKGEERPHSLVELFLDVFAASALSLYDSGDGELTVYTLATRLVVRHTEIVMVSLSAPVVL